MAAYIFAIAFLVILAAAGLAAYFDLTPDSRDSDWSMGLVMRPRNPHA